MEYTIQNEELTLTISSHGAEKQKLVSKNGINYLRTKDEYWDRIAPFLFPIVGKLRDLKTFIHQKEYHMNQHGFLRDQEFQVLHHGKDKIELIQTSTEETKALYPFDYEVHITYELKGKTLITTFSVTNLSKEEMPFNFGGHPGFRCPLYPNETFEDYAIEFEQEENFDAPTVVLENGTLNYHETIPYRHLKRLPLKWSYFEIDAIIHPTIQSKWVKLVNKEHKGILFSYPDFPMLAIWTRPNAPFVCLEPWFGHADTCDSDYDFLKKRNLIFLSPNETFKTHYDITILDKSM